MSCEFVFIIIKNITLELHVILLLNFVLLDMV